MWLKKEIDNEVDESRKEKEIEKRDGNKKEISRRILIDKEKKIVENVKKKFVEKRRNEDKRW